jgi:outer membrane protein TolC
MLQGVKMQPNFLQSKKRRSRALLTGAFAFLWIAAAYGQTPAETTAADKPITLEEAIHRAEANEPAYAASSAESRALGLDRSIARAGLLPGVVYHNQALYTQPNNDRTPAAAAQTTQKFIANNGVHEYASQAVINETFGLGGLAGVRRADAAAARAKAELEVARGRCQTGRCPAGEP